jgi:D-amino peptidase
MKVFISADIEGITGLLSWAQCAGPGDEEAADWAFAREMMTHDVNAAIRGARKGGAKHVVVKDSHGGGKNLLVSDLEPGTELISGGGCGHHDGMMEGIDSTYDAAFLVGYHAKAGTHKAIMCHTISGKVHRLRINGREFGEIGLSAGTAGRYLVPLVTVCSDHAGCAEAKSFIPGVHTAAVKNGLGRFMGTCLHPDQTAALIESAAAAGVKNQPAVEPFKIEPPVEIEMVFKGEAEADYAERLAGTHRADAYTIQCRCESYEEAHRTVRLLITLADVGSSSGE